MEERKNHDFIKFHRKDLDWLAFVWILLTVNLVLIGLDSYILEKTYHSNKPLKPLMEQLLGNHMLQFIFLRDFYNKLHRVNTNHKWVWVVHALNYPYICYVYFATDAFE